MMNVDRTLQEQYDEIVRMEGYFQCAYEVLCPQPKPKPPKGPTWEVWRKGSGPETIEAPTAAHAAEAFAQKYLVVTLTIGGPDRSPRSASHCVIGVLGEGETQWFDICSKHMLEAHRLPSDFARATTEAAGRGIHKAVE